MNKQKGMTLVELMAVIAIAGALAAMAIPKLSSLTVKAKNTELKIQISTFYRVMEAHNAFYGENATSFASLGFVLPKSNFFTYTAINDANEGGAGNTGKGASHKMTVCHENHPINVATVAVYNAHLDHGDSGGDCPLGMEISPLFSYSSDCPAGSKMETTWTPSGGSLIDVDAECADLIF